MKTTIGDDIGVQSITSRMRRVERDVDLPAKQEQVISLQGVVLKLYQPELDYGKNVKDKISATIILTVSRFKCV
jgi:hypothetical protein